MSCYDLFLDKLLYTATFDRLSGESVVPIIGV